MSEEITQKTSYRARELGAFLRSRRKSLTPQQVGLAAGERRRVDGLRREEVANLAGIGITWYTWLEQGRDIHVSSTALLNLARVLQLSADEQEYLFTLTGYPHSSPSASQTPPGPLAIPPLLQQFLTTLPYPAHLQDQHWDILAWNSAELSFYPWEALAPDERNALIHLFTHPLPRHHLANWEAQARSQQRLFRMALAHHPEDQRFFEIVTFLQQRSKVFPLWWQEHLVQQHSFETIEWHLPHRHPQRFTPLHLTLSSHPSWSIRVLFPASDSPFESERFSISQQSRKMPLGTCLNIAEIPCTFVELPCFHCPAFVLTPEDLPALEMYEQQILERIEVGKQTRNAHWVEINQSNLHTQVRPALTLLQQGQTVQFGERAK
jgi:transcriptional regulator with XRE-family HTH domain